MTATKIIWGEQMALTVARALEDVQKSFYEAQENGGWVVIKGDDGQKVSINPGRVLYLEEIDVPDLSGARRQSARRQSARRQPRAPDGSLA